MEKVNIGSVYSKWRYHVAIQPLSHGAARQILQLVEIFWSNYWVQLFHGYFYVFVVYDVIVFMGL